MLPILTLSSEQLEAYRPIWGEFTTFACTFLQVGRAFAFMGRLAVTQDGAVALRDLLVARSCWCGLGEARRHFARLLREARAAGWDCRGDGAEAQATQGPFRLTLLCTAREEAAAHLILEYGEASALREDYFAEVSSPVVADDGRPSSHFYPVRVECAPDEAEEIAIEELAARMAERRCVAFTGAGISLASGIPTFRGEGGLDQSFPLFDDYPGVVAEWMIHRPQQMALILGRFRTGFIAARPNQAHLALAALERRGVLASVITGNSDRLHERAGSERVHLKEPHSFSEDGEGWGWIREGSVFVVVGVAEDEHGLISYARDHGVQVVALAPTRPEFLCAGDWFVAGAAETVLPQVVNALARA